MWMWNFKCYNCRIDDLESNPILIINFVEHLFVEALNLTHLVKKFPKVFGSRGLISVFIRIYVLSLASAR